MEYGIGNILINYNGQQVEYDADGNMIYGPLNGQMVQYIYDARNRLISAGDTRYEYDAENNRIAVIEKGKKTEYVINPNALLSQVLIRSDADGKQTFYIYGLGLIAQEDSEGNYLTYHYDSRGSTVAITDEEGKVTDRFEYGPYGELISRSGDTDTPFLFNGREGVMTDGNGLYYMRARYYNSEIKRFINQDVMQGTVENGQSLNRYAYSNGNPISYIDPYGMSPLDSETVWNGTGGANGSLWENAWRYIRGIASDVLDFTQGFGAGILETYTYGLSNVLEDYFHRKDERVYLIGKIVGNAISGIAGVMEIGGGVTYTVGTGGVGAVAGGAVVVVHGGTVIISSYGELSRILCLIKVT